MYFLIAYLVSMVRDFWWQECERKLGTAKKSWETIYREKKAIRVYFPQFTGDWEYVKVRLYPESKSLSQNEKKGNIYEMIIFYSLPL